MDDPFFDSVTEDDDDLEAQFDVNGKTVLILFETWELDAAREMAKLIQKEIGAITKSLAKDIVDDVYDDVDPKPNATELARRISLREISFSDDVGAECFFNGDGLFGNHDPCVWVKQDGEIDEGHIAG